MSRWDFLYEQTARPAKDYVLDEVARQLAEQLRAWPPRVDEWSSEADRSRFTAALEGPRPRDDVFRLAFELCRWDLERRYDDVDAFMKSERWRERAKSETEFDAACFLWRWTEEQALAFQEWAQGKFTRSELADLVARLERKLLDTRAPLLN